MININVSHGRVAIWASTPKLEALPHYWFSETSMEDEPFNVAFIEEIEKIFEENNVAWSNNPFFLIKQQA
ncbi:MAG: hypothetical protein Q8L73_08295 [Methylotenera sp.]|nr:hypothetical protein [Methylotenera sp.]